ncbi:MAG: sigma-70 family RNA polymerase sigma factor [Nitrospirota bacterium]
MARIKKGDVNAFELLLSRHERSVYNLAYRFLNDEGEAEDITQEVFLRVYRASKTYNPEAKFTTWLYTIVKNLCFNAIRKKRSVSVVSIDEETMPEFRSEDPDPLDALSREELRSRVIRAVNALPENMRIAVILQRFHGFSTEEIAELMGCSVNAVKLRVHRAKMILAGKLGGLKEET